jgi:hypothetical protein
MSTNEYSMEKQLLATRLALGKGILRTKFLTDFISNGHRYTEESINSFESGLAELIKAELIEKYNVAYEQADIIKKEENKQTKNQKKGKTHKQ